MLNRTGESKSKGKDVKLKASPHSNKRKPQVLDIFDEKNDSFEDAVRPLLGVPLCSATLN